RSPTFCLCSDQLSRLLHVEILGLRRKRLVGFLFEFLKFCVRRHRAVTDPKLPRNLTPLPSYGPRPAPGFRRKRFKTIQVRRSYVQVAGRSAVSSCTTSLMHIAERPEIFAP